jgi:hypothetical protein
MTTEEVRGDSAPSWDGESGCHHLASLITLCIRIRSAFLGGNSDHVFPVFVVVLFSKEIGNLGFI